MNNFHYLITKFNTNDNIETNASGLSIELRRLANILVNLKKTQETQKNLLLIDGLIKATVFEENLSLSAAFIEFMILNSQTLGILTTKEIELINLLKVHKNINFLRLNQNFRLVGLGEEKNNGNSNLMNLFERFNASTDFLKLFKRRNLKKLTTVVDSTNEEQKYLEKLKECLKQCIFIEVSRLAPEEKRKGRSELLQKFFK